MIPCLIVLGLLVGCPGDSERPPAAALQEPDPVSSPAPVDAWVGQDKLRHLALSFSATAFSYGLGRFALDPEPAAWAAAGAALGAGLAKELLDQRAGRGFSARDLAWNAAGVALALTLADGIR